MQPCSRETQGGMNMNSLLHNNVSPSQHHHHQHALHDPHNPIHGANFDTAASDQDFLDQMFSTINPSWPDLNPTDCPEPAADNNGNSIGPFGTHFDESAILASKLRQHRISSGGGPSTSVAAAAKAMLLQQQMLMGRGFESSHGDIPGVDESVQALYNGFSGSTHAGGGQPLNQSPQFHHPQGGSPTFGAQGQATKPATATSGSTTAASGGGGSTTTGQPKQRVRARRGQATDPHSIAERLRRERIAERMKALQELVPNGNKADKASMLDEIIDYVKFLQLQVKVLSMSRLGGAAAVAPLVADMSSEVGSGDCVQASGGGGRNGNGSAIDSLSMAEHQVAKLMEEDMGAAMQYLQVKGLCLMPISLASAISTATCHSGRSTVAHSNPHTASNGDGPTSPSMSSMLTVQSAIAANGSGPDGLSAKDAASASKP